MLNKCEIINFYVSWYKKMKISFHINSDILKDRLVFGEFYHLYFQLRNNDDLFRSYTRTTVYLIEIIRPEFNSEINLSLYFLFHLFHGTFLFRNSAIKISMVIYVRIVRRND
jgi:hypothetical protein|uniref:Uncharacterized protein n=1 Tax=Sipha flava TaxID=143950 RepID=A0A2S2R1Z4_9HEMI